jgi:hypothetical protein
MLYLINPEVCMVLHIYMVDSLMRILSIVYGFFLWMGFIGQAWIFLVLYLYIF